MKIIVLCNVMDVMEVMLFNPDDERCLPVEKWTKKIELFCERYEFSDDQMLCFARGKLEGRAKFWFDGTSKVNNWCDFRREIQKTFCDAKNIQSKVGTSEKPLPTNNSINLKHNLKLMKATEEVVGISQKLYCNELDLLADDLERSILGEIISSYEFPDVIINIMTIITNDIERSLKNLLIEHRSAVSTGFNDLGTSRTHELVINIKSHRSIKIFKSVKHIAHPLLQQLLTSGSTQNSKSKACNNWILNNDQLILDLRELNSTATQEPVDLINLEPLLYSLPYFKYFTTLSFNGGHLQIPVQSSSRKHLTFATNLGTYEYCKAPKHFFNTSIVFSKILIEVVRKLRPGDAVAIFDELVIPSMTLKEGLQKLSTVLGALSAFGLTVDLRESRFFSKEMRLFQWRISYSQRSFEGFCVRSNEPAWNYLKNHDLCDSQNEAMQNLKYLDFREECELHFTVAGNELISILLQTRKNKPSTVLGFYSKIIPSNIDKSSKQSAITESILNFRRFLVYKPFKIVTEIHWIVAIMKGYKRGNKLLEHLLQVQELKFSVMFVENNQAKLIQF